MRKPLRFFFVISFLSIIAPPNLHAQNASLVCAEAARTLLNGSTTRQNDTPAVKSGAPATINWSSVDGHQGVCQVDREGRVFSVEVTQFPQLSQVPYSLTCTSPRYRRQECGLKGPGTAVLERQISKTQCTQGQTWGQINTTLWVDKGCSGSFRITPRPAWSTYTLKCESPSNRRAECRLKGPAEVRMTQQLSKSACRQGSTWNYQGDMLWVDRGCRASFQVSPVSVAAPGFENQREEALQACNNLAKGLGFTVRQQQITASGNRNVDVKINAERNRIQVDLMCRYDLITREARFYDS